MPEKSLRGAGPSLEEAKANLKEQIPRGFLVVSETIDSDGAPRSVVATADTAETAFAEASKQVPEGAAIRERKETVSSERVTITVEAFDDQVAAEKAKAEASSRLGRTGQVATVRRATTGSGGFLGIGKKPHGYQVEIFRQASVEITYALPALINATVADRDSILAHLTSSAEVCEPTFQALQRLEWQPDSADKALASAYWCAYARSAGSSIRKASSDQEKMSLIKELGKASIPDSEAMGIAVKEIAALLGDGGSGVSYHAAIALGDLGDSRAVEPLIGSLRTGKTSNGMGGVRTYAAEALGKIGDRTAVGALEAAAAADTSQSGHIREAAEFALERMSPDSRWAKLIPSLEALVPQSAGKLNRSSVTSSIFAEPKAVVRAIQDELGNYTRIREESTSASSIVFVFDNYVRLGGDVAPATRELEMTVVRDGTSYRISSEGRFL